MAESRAGSLKVMPVISGLSRRNKTLLPHDPSDERDEVIPHPRIRP